MPVPAGFSFLFLEKSLSYTADISCQSRIDDSYKRAHHPTFRSMSTVVNCRPSQQLLSSCCTARGRQSQYFTMGHPSPQNCPFAWPDLDPHLYMVFCAHPSPQPKRHLDRFSDFCRGDVLTDRPTDRKTMLLGL